MPAKRFVKPGSRMYKKRPVSSGSGTYYSGDYESCRKGRAKPWLEDECENTVNINTNITVNQSNQANSSGGDGGNGGSATASTATAISTGDGDAAARTSSEIENKDEHTQNEVEQEAGSADKLKQPIPTAVQASQLETQDVEALEDVGDVSSASAATGGAGGGGGGGGELSATQSNSSTIDVDCVNVVILTCNGDAPLSNIGLGANGRTVDIRVENGETFVNGQRMAEQSLPNGTKVYVFQTSENSKQVNGEPVPDE